MTQDYTVVEQAGFYFCCMSQVLGLVLNVHWMTLIVKGLLRMVKGKKPKADVGSTEGSQERGKEKREKHE